MKLLIVAAIFVCATQSGVAAKEWVVTLDSTPVTVDMGQERLIPFSVTFPGDTPSPRPELIVASTDPEVAKGRDPQFFDSDPDETTHWNDSIVIRGVFLGNAKISLIARTNEGNFVSNVLEVTVIRPKRLVDTLFTVSVATLVSILYINFGCAIDWSVCRDTMRSPIGPAIGSFCQFLMMPLFSYAIGLLLFPDRPELRLGIFFTGISPSGGASNIWTVVLGGNLNLSITMTTLGTLASFATMPIWIFTLGQRIFDKGNLGVPYSRVATLAVGLIIPLALGYAIQRKLPNLSRVLVRVMKPFSAILIIFIVVFAIITNLYLVKLFSWQIVAAGLGLPWLGYMCGWMAMVIFRQPAGDVRAIAIETGIQNTGIAIFLLRFSLAQPAADLTTVIPVSCAMMTPVPLTVIWLIKLVVERRKKKNAASMEKLRTVAEPVNAITPTTTSTIFP